MSPRRGSVGSFQPKPAPASTRVEHFLSGRAGKLDRAIGRDLHERSWRACNARGAVSVRLESGIGSGIPIEPSYLLRVSEQAEHFGSALIARESFRRMPLELPTGGHPAAAGDARAP